GQSQEWDVRSAEPVQIREFCAESTPIAFSTDGRLIVAASRPENNKTPVTLGGSPTSTDPIARPWPPAASKPPEAIREPFPEPRVRAWDALTGLPLLDYEGACRPLIALNFSPDRLRLVGRTSDGGVAVWEHKSGKRLADFQAPKGTLRAA